MEHLLYNDRGMPVVCERPDWKNCPEHKYLSLRRPPVMPKAPIFEDNVGSSEDDIITMDEYDALVKDANVEQFMYNEDLYEAKHIRDVSGRKYVNITSGELEFCEYGEDGCTEHYHGQRMNKDTPGFGEASAKAKASLDLPELPEGYSFELKESKEPKKAVLRLKKKNLFGSKVVSSQQVFIEDNRDFNGEPSSLYVCLPKQTIEGTANNLVKDALKREDMEYVYTSEFRRTHQYMEPKEAYGAYDLLYGEL